RDRQVEPRLQRVAAGRERDQHPEPEEPPRDAVRPILFAHAAPSLPAPRPRILPRGVRQLHFRKSPPDPQVSEKSTVASRGLGGDLWTRRRLADPRPTTSGSRDAV